MVLKTMEGAVKKQNFEQFRSVLSDSFVYIPDEITLAMYPDVDWANWGISQEENFLRRFLSPVLKPDLHLTDEIDENTMPVDHRSLITLTYHFVIEGRPFVSEAAFHFVESDHKWFLWKWEEKAAVLMPNGGGFFSNSGVVRASLTP